MQHRNLILILVLLHLFGGCSPNHSTKEEQRMEDFIRQYYKIMSARDWIAYANFFTARATLTTIWQSESDSIPKVTISSISEFLTQTKDGPDSQPIFEEKPEKIEVTIKHDLAAVWVKYKAKFGSDSQITVWSGQDLFSLIKFNDEWKIASLVYETSD